MQDRIYQTLVLGHGLSETPLDWHLNWLIAKHCGRCCWWMVQEILGLC